MLVPDCAGQEAWWEPSTCRAGDAAGHSTCRAGDGPGVARVAVPIQPTARAASAFDLMHAPMAAKPHLNIYQGETQGERGRLALLWRAFTHERN